MPKATKKPPGDPSQAARSILDQITGEKPKVVPPEKNASMAERGAKGGAKGGKARASVLSADDRKRIAQDAARKRWRTEPVD